MIRSLVSAAGDLELESDVHVIGAGIAGLLLATRLAKRGLRVIVTESGAERQNGETHPLNAVEHVRSVYKGAELGRARCLGGTSTLWGGAMIPFLAADLEQGAWPIDYSEIIRHLPEIEALFALPQGPYDEPALMGGTNGEAPSHLARLAKWPSFRRRNIASLLNTEIGAATGPDIWLEATAEHFAFAPDGRVDSVTAFAPGGRKLTVSARETVIAAGAIECTRLLLLADRQANDQIFSHHRVLGRYFGDHLSVCVGIVEPHDRVALNRLVGFRFQGSGMRNLRFELREKADERHRLPPSFAHIAFVAPAGSGFDALRDLFRSLQRRRLPGPTVLLALARETPWLASAARWRFQEHRLLYPRDARIELHMVIEQEPCADNRVLLSTDQYDCYGKPLAAIDWHVSTQDQWRLTRSTDCFLSFWEKSAAASLASIRRRPAGEAEMELADGNGIYHPTGSTRMGRTSADGVVDADLRCFGIPNLSVAATSVFPTGGGANPTMMLMLATLRLADRLSASAHKALGDR